MTPLPPFQLEMCPVARARPFFFGARDFSLGAAPFAFTTFSGSTGPAQKYLVFLIVAYFLN